MEHRGKLTFFTKIRILEFSFCLLFSIFETIGILIYKYNTVYPKDFIYRCSGIFISTLAISAPIIHSITEYLASDSKQIRSKIIKTAISVYENHALLIDIFFILLGWLPWVISFYPGSLFYDMTHQLDQYYGGYTLQTHPPFSTLVMGGCMDFGKAVFHSDNIGLFSYILLQTLVCVIGCCYSLYAMRKIGTNTSYVIIALLFYAFFPLLGASAQCAEKDVIHYGLTLLTGTQYLLFFYKVKDNADNSLCKELWLYIFFSFVSSLFRKEMAVVYTILSLVLFTYLIIKSKKIKIAVVLILCILFNYNMSYISNDVIPKVIFHREFGEGESEMFSIPLQHLARYVKFKGDTLSDEEKAIIGDSFYYGYDKISSSYNPNLSDPIKYNFNRGQAAQNGFWGTYLSLLFRDPGLFVESVLAGSYGYFSVVPNVPTSVDGAPTNGLPGGRIPTMYMELGPDQSFHFLDVHYLDSLYFFRIRLTAWVYGFELPFNLLYSFGFYTWMVLLLLSISIIKRGLVSGFPYILCLLLILVCIASPVNDYGRYYMSVIYLIPLMCGYTKCGGMKKAG